MNEFTKEELWNLHNICQLKIDRIDDDAITYNLRDKIRSMIDNYPAFNTKKIAASHLNEAESLISHAIGLLGLRGE